VDGNLRESQGGQQAQLPRAQERSGGQCQLAGADVAAGVADEVPCSGSGQAHRGRLPGGGKGSGDRLFNRHDGVGPGRHHGAGHDRGGRAGGKLRRCASGGDGRDDAQLRTAAGHIRAADGETVHLGVRERRQVQRRQDVRCEPPAEGRQKREPFRPVLAAERGQQPADLLAVRVHADPGGRSTVRLHGGGIPGGGGVLSVRALVHALPDLSS